MSSDRELKTVWILRRMRRKSISRLPWKLYNPRKATAEERRFDMFGPDGRFLGQIVCTDLGFRKSSMTTPWGPATTEFEKGGSHIYLGGKELVRLGAGVFRSGMTLTFPSGVSMTFRPVRGKKNDIEFSDENSMVWVQEETGRLEDLGRGTPLQPTKEDIMMMPKRERLRSVESNEYFQLRFMTMGRLPVPQDEVLRALTIYAVWGCLIDESTRTW